MLARRVFSTLTVIAAMPAASHGVGWTSPSPLGGAGDHNLTVADLAPLPNGDARVAIHDVSDIVAPQIVVARLTAAGLTDRTPLDPLGDDPHVASDALGNTVTVWRRAGALWAITSAPDGTRSAPQQILTPSSSREVRSFAIAMTAAPSGAPRAVVLAAVDNTPLYAQGGPTGSVFAVMSDGGTWQPAVRVAIGLTGPKLVRLVLTSRGFGVGGWADATRAFAARISSDGVWSDVRRIATLRPSDLGVAIGENGATTVAWIQRGPGVGRLLVRSRPGTAGPYGAATQLATGSLTNLRAGADAGGTTTLVWMKEARGEHRIQHTVQRAAGRWAPVGLLDLRSASSARIVALDAAINPRGDAVVAWTVSNGTAADFFARSRAGGSSFAGRERPLPAGDGRVNAPVRVVLGASGAVAASYGVGDGNCCSRLVGVLRPAVRVPAVSSVTVPGRVASTATGIRVGFRLSAPGRVVVSMRRSLRAPARLVRIVNGRTGANAVVAPTGGVALPAGSYLVSVGTTADPVGPGSVARRVTVVRAVPRPIP